MLKRYLMAWFPIMATQYRDRGITYMDGFAGPGEYLNSDESSPVIAMSQAHRGDVARHGAQIRMLFIESDVRRFNHLRSLLDSRFPETGRPGPMRVSVVNDRCQDAYDGAMAELGGWSGPVFANLDGWGVDTYYDLVCRVGNQPSSEVLITFNDQFLIRFASVEEQEVGDRVFGDRGWRKVARTRGKGEESLSVVALSGPAAARRVPARPDVRDD